MKVVLDQLRALARPNPAWLALAAALLLTAMGITAIAGSSRPTAAVDQSQWLVIALAAMIVVLLPNPRMLGLATGPLLLVVIGLLAVLVMPGVPRWLVLPHYGARCWINFYFMDFQPSEITKIVFVMALARYLRFRQNYRTLSGLLLPFLIMLLPVLLILLQPDLGTAILFVPALFVVLVAAGAMMRHMWTLLGLAVLIVAINVTMIFLLPSNSKLHLLKKHQRVRILAMVNLAKDDDRYVGTTGFQQDRAMRLVGSGQFVGYGAEKSPTIVRLNAVPKDYNDMIFAVIVNRWGLLGGLTVMGLHLILAISFLIVAVRSRDPFARLTIIGLLGLLGSQMVINIGMTLGLVPIIGVTLPFVSYGGSSLVASFIMVGLLLNFASRGPQPFGRPSFEFDNADVIFQ